MHANASEPFFASLFLPSNSPFQWRKSGISRQNTYLQSPYMIAARAIHLKRSVYNQSPIGMASPMMGYIALRVRLLCTRQMSLIAIYKMQLIVNDRFVTCL